MANSSPVVILYTQTDLEGARALERQVTDWGFPCVLQHSIAPSDLAQHIAQASAVIVCICNAHPNDESYCQSVGQATLCHKELLRIPPKILHMLTPAAPANNTTQMLDASIPVEAKQALDNMRTTLHKQCSHDSEPAQQEDDKDADDDDLEALVDPDHVTKHNSCNSCNSSNGHNGRKDDGDDAQEDMARGRVEPPLGSSNQSPPAPFTTKLSRRSQTIMRSMLRSDARVCMELARSLSDADPNKLVEGIGQLLSENEAGPSGSPEC